MTSSLRCMICDMAMFELGMSEREFYRSYSFEERNQLVATYRSKIRRDAVMARYPPRAQRRQRQG